ncbi:MAG: hypothetical protein IJT75_04490 [Bacteroidaceae bacterium]|nr:hypothetical protein [Bacteroidaceae bacterium]
MAAEGQVAAQDEKGFHPTLTGSIHVSALRGERDSIKTKDGDYTHTNYNSKFMANTYADLHMQSSFLDAGARVEWNEYPLPGYDPAFKGWGLAHIYARAHWQNLAIMVGDFYEQFGSGFILRTYEERSLGIDNSLRGAHVAVRPFAGLNLKVLSGRQRAYWKHNKSWVSGADAELSLEEWVPTLREHGTYLTLGGSYVNKYEKDEDIFVDNTHRLHLPTMVHAFDVRARVQSGAWNVLAEYAQKSQDPNFDNNYIYRRGYVAMLSGSYSKRGMSLLLQAKRSDNMSFRSRRALDPDYRTSSTVNHLPAFTMDHTYALAALYPYATNPDGEWAYQAEGSYKFNRHTLLGGKYGTTVKVNFSHVHSIATNPHLLNGQLMGSDGYGSPFWKWGDETYYQDLNVQIDKKVSNAFKLNLMYMNQRYNKTAVEGKGGMIDSHIAIAEGKYRFNKTFTLRGEAQYLFTKDDDGDWAFGLLELSVMPHWMFTVSDMYNAGETHEHYYQGSVTFNTGAHRVQLGYGRTRAGYNCTGGVCRYVPATKGFTLSYNYNF